MDVYQQLAKALRRAVDAHGAPNRFSLGELHAEYGGPRPLAVGRLTRYGERNLMENNVTVYLGLPIEYQAGSPTMIAVATADGYFQGALP
jgi:hypothetical protein